MSVVYTLSLLNKLNLLSKQEQEAKLAELHREVLCDSLRGYFPQASLEEIQQELLTRGLFNFSEIETLDEVLMELEGQHVWETIQQEYDYLKQLWNGPDVPIFIYPLTKYRPIVDGVEVKKSGVSYNNVLFLFVSTELESMELKALLAHEYHHLCRLAYLNKSPHEIELLDTLLIEGMAEWTVENLYGEKWLSPWTKRNSQEEALKMWEKYFTPALKVKGVNNHFPFLYGNEVQGLPEWIGYSLGYKIVQSYMENRGIVHQEYLHKLSSYEILKGSVYKV